MLTVHFLNQLTDYWLKIIEKQCCHIKQCIFVLVKVSQKCPIILHITTTQLSMKLYSQMFKLVWITPVD